MTDAKWHHVVEDGVKVGYPCAGWSCEHCRRESAAKAPPPETQTDSRNYCD